MERKPSGFFSGFLVISLIVFVLAVLAFGRVELQCRQAYYESYLYPDAELISERHNSIGAFGNGATNAVYRTSDDLDDVDAWFKRGQVRVIKEQVIWSLEENNEGTTITVIYTCPYIG